MNPLVSIIIPTFSRPENLCRAIESVLSQTYKNIEVIVVDDNGIGSENQLETEKILEPYINANQITYVKHKFNKNGSAARNTGTKVSHGQIVGYLDDDDVFCPNKIEEQVRRLEEAHISRAVVAGVYCNILMKGYTNGPQKLISKKEGKLSEALLLSEIRFNSSTILIYRWAYDSIGGWDERFKRHQDWEFCIRFFDKFEMVIAKPDECLIEKYCTVNYHTYNPEKSAPNAEFFMNEMRQYISKMTRCDEIYSFKYWGIARDFIAFRMYKSGLKYIKLTYKYRNIRPCDLIDLIKSFIKGFIKK